MPLFKTFASTKPFDPRAFRLFPRFLYYLMADRDREVLGIGVKAMVEASTAMDAMPMWRAFLDEQTGVTMGHATYGLKDGLERLTSRHGDPFHRPIVRWFAPLVYAERVHGQWTLIFSPEDEDFANEVLKALGSPTEPPGTLLVPPTWTCSTDPTRYLEHANTLMAHLRCGDIYELNYCIQRTTSGSIWDPFAAGEMLLKNTGAPCASFYRWDEQYALCASPERFLRFEQGQVWSEPMKGTRRRKDDPVEDRIELDRLAEDQKERAENIMATDVVRNDLSRIAASGSVKVEELCSVRSHRLVHQMVSNVSAVLRSGYQPLDAVQAAFPMASMTGAPKLRAMQLIDEHEAHGRGLFSGTIGWLGPDRTGDLNVVIRTLEYDGRTGFSRLLTGSALTAACDPEREWEECALKARSVLEAIGHASA